MNSREEQLKAFGRLLDVLDELREKCPWDRKQTNESLRPNTIEETYELCEALMRNDDKTFVKNWAMCCCMCVFMPKSAQKKNSSIWPMCAINYAINSYSAIPTCFRPKAKNNRRPKLHNKLSNSGNC